MRRPSPVLLVLLGASLLANVLLAVRLSRQVAPPSAAPRPPSPASEKPSATADETSLRASLETERRTNEDLRLRVERLEADKKVLAQDPAAGAGKPDRLATFREKLRKFMKLMKDPAAKAGALDPDATVELTDTMMEFIRMTATRAKEPKAYADYLQAFYEVALEGEGAALSDAQSATLSKLFQDLGQELSRIPPTPAGDRLIRELESESAAMRRVGDILSEAQRSAMLKDNLSTFAAGNLMSMSYITKEGAADQVAQLWSQVYQLDPSQLPQAKAAAQSYVDALSRLDAERKGSSAAQGTPDSFDYRIRSVREQMAALAVLQASLTPAQQDRVRTQAPREFTLFDTQGVQSVTVPADK